MPDTSVTCEDLLSREELEQFTQRGYLIVRGLTPPDMLERMQRVTRHGLDNEIGPVEFEAEVQYPGSPRSLEDVGGRTIRRLKQAYTRDYCFTDWMLQPEVLGRLQQLVGPRVVCPLAHHNCIMTKQPAFSSETGWHQDIRYWSFERPELVNAWIALGHETPENGCLQVIPGSHRAPFSAQQFDAARFFRTDVPDNEPWIARREFVTLAPGDVLFFHCLLLHAASRNSTTQTKFSAVFTFRPHDNPPLPGSRSAALPELLLPSPLRGLGRV